MTNLHLSIEEAQNLFDAFHYYGKHIALESAEDMMISEEPCPLINHWVDFDEFLTVWDVFYKMSREMNRISFGKSVVECTVPCHYVLSELQKNIFTSPEEFKRQACYLLSYFDSMSDFFDYEIHMIERGYPRRRSNAA